MRITKEQALERLQQYEGGGTPCFSAPSKNGKAKAKSLEVKQVIGNADDDLIIAGNANGGILTTLNDGLPAIIGTWEEGNEIPPSLQDMLSEYVDEVEWWERVGEEFAQESQANAPAKAKAAPRQSIPAMIKTKWSQNAPYNDLCIFEGKRCKTGCNATAASQIMFHWREYHRGCGPTDPYVTSTNGYEVEALPVKIVFDYKNLVAKPKTDTQKRAVAELMAYIGRAIHSNYTPNGTGAYLHKVAEHLRDNFRMGSFVSYITAAKLGLQSFENYIYNELLQGRPVIVGGHLDSGSGGHAFILDGYDATNDLYHVNWGWGGSYDGWFKITALNATSSYHFNSKKDAVIGIKPEYKLGDVNNDGEVNITDVMQVVQDAQDGKYSQKADINLDGKVTVIDAQLIINKVLGKIEL